MQEKDSLRKQLRAKRRKHAESLPESMRGLVFRHPPASLLAMIPEGAIIGIYRSMPFEAPTISYAKYLYENGFSLSLPRFKTRNAAMEFAVFQDPFQESDLEVGPFGLMQPRQEAERLTPDLLIMPLVGFTERGERLGQGGGHYDRWLSRHPGTPAFGLAWDAQLCNDIPTEPHDIPLDAVITPTRFYGPF